MHVTQLSRSGIIEKCNELISEKDCKSVVTLNSLMLKRSWENMELAEALKNADFITVDSIGVRLAAYLLEGKKVCRYPGIEMIEDLIKQGHSIYLLGSKPGVAEKAGSNLSSKYPHLNICGTRDGYFDETGEEELISEINKSKPDIVFVGLNMVRQEIWINANKKKLNARLVVGVGGSFDVISGGLKRAPEFFKITGLEWFWRTLLEPWRIVRIIGLPVFLLEVFQRLLEKQPLLD
jgi:N-acetylglucosaminyldiphosphoundecaprenol N-acetyl-beta-D-mannosaminyltransferase